MSVFRTYFSKNNTLIDGNLTNNSQNPVSEVSYWTVNSFPSRLIFALDFSDLHQRIADGFINPDRIVKHVLHMTNTIQHAQQYIGKRSYTLEIERASSFELEVFNIDQEWDEGSGYDFVYEDEPHPQLPREASNWYYRKTDVPWTVSGGSYISGATPILGTQRFENGSEDLEIDITEYVNAQLGLSGATGFTATTYGLGVKFIDDLEMLETIYRQAVAFHVKDTHTFYEPYVETVIDDVIEDDRNYFYLDKDNDLYLYSNVGGDAQDITVNSVEIYDYEDNLAMIATGDSIVNVGKGVYKITINVPSLIYPDAVMFTDKWSLTVNGRAVEYENQFYLISQNKYYTFDQSNEIDPRNYSFYYWGIQQQEKIVAGDVKKIKITIKELYPNQDNFLPLDIEYRLFTTVGSKYELEVIPFTPVNRTSKGYEFNLDTSWLIPQDYCLQLRLKNGNFYENKKCMEFTVISNGIVK